MKFLALFSLLALSAYALPTDSTLSSTTDIESNALVARADDYPYKSSCPGSDAVDPWKFYKCQCTSFVAWRIVDRLDKHFKNDYKGQHFGNANNWDNAARSAGLTVNKTPKVNSVAMTNAGSAGHVAWVVGVSGGDVTVEEYNWNNREDYGKRTVAKGKFDYYIHF